MRFRGITRAAAALLLAACSRDQQTTAAGDGAVVSRRGDTTVVTTNGDGIWGPAHDAVPVLSVATETRETSFGQVRTMAAMPDGGVLVFDAKSADGKRIREFDSLGTFVRNTGHEGSGPGEYNTIDLRIVPQQNGTILVRDHFRGVVRYSRDGRFLSGFPLQIGGGFADIAGVADGSIYLPAIYTLGRRAPAGRPPIIRYDTTGRVLDTIAPDPAWRVTNEPESPGVVNERWVPLPDGRMVVGRSDKVGFLLLDVRGTNPPLIAEHAAAPVPYLDEEQKERQAKAAELKDGVVIEGERLPTPSRATDVSSLKPAMTWLQIDIDGRIWLRTAAPSQKVTPFCTLYVESRCVTTASYRQPPVFAVFEPDGKYLGEVRFPLMASHITATGPYAWAMVPDADDVPVLTKFRLY